MTDATANPKITVYQYGLKPPLDWAADCEAEVDRMRHLWNKLVEIEHAHRAAVFQIGADAAAAPTREAEQLTSALDAALTRRKALRQASRGKKVAPDLDAEITDLRARRARAYAAAKALRQEVRAQSRAQLQALEAARKAAVKAARQSCGCFWGNYNAVIASYETARQRAIKTASELRFRSARRRDARIVNQIQGGGSFAQALTGAINGQVSLRPHDLERKASGRKRPEYRLTATVYTRGRGARRTVTWPLILHREWPPGAVIKEVVITRRTATARRDEWAASFLLALPDEPMVRHDRAACGIDIGWRRRNDGVRVASLVDDAGRTDDVVLPERIVSGFRHADALVSDLDRRTNDRVARLKALPWDTAPPVLRDLTAPLRTLPRVTVGMLARLTADWQRLAATWQAEALGDAQATVRANTRDLREKAGLTRRLRLARRDHYRKTALALAARHHLIGIEGNLSISDLSRRDDNPTPEPSRWYRKIAAPGEFVAALRHAAGKQGSVLHEHAGKSTWVCAECGVEQTPRDPAALIVTCPGCSAVWDQDQNAARNLLAAARASAAAARAEPGALAPQTGGENREPRWQKARRIAAGKASARNPDNSP